MTVWMPIISNLVVTRRNRYAALQLHFINTMATRAKTAEAEETFDFIESSASDFISS